MKHFPLTESFLLTVVFCTGGALLVTAVLSCSKTSSANPVDEPETHPMGVSITIYEDAFARCYTFYQNGISCIPKVQPK